MVLSHMRDDHAEGRSNTHVRKYEFFFTNENTNTSTEDLSACNITLYSDVYHTGDSLTLSSQVTDLTPWNFADCLASLKVEVLTALCWPLGPVHLRRGAGDPSALQVSSASRC